MPRKPKPSEAVVISTADELAHFHLSQMIGRLRIEVRTGLSFKTSTLAEVRRVYKIPAGRKTTALAQLEAIYQERYGRTWGAERGAA